MPSLANSPARRPDSGLARPWSGTGIQRAIGPAVLTLALTVFWAAGAAASATGAPLSLLPGGAAPPIAVPAPSLPAPSAPAAPSFATPSQPISPTPGKIQQIAPPPGSSGSAIAFGRLAAPDPSSLGLLTPGHGGLPPTLWQGTDRARVDRLLALLPASPSPVAQRLTRRLLLSAADVPSGGPTGPGLLALRIARLTATGDAKDAAALAALAPPDLNDPAFLRAAADADWLAGENQAACTRTGTALAQEDQFTWDVAGAFCRALAGEKAQARLTLDLLRESPSPHATANPDHANAPDATPAARTQTLDLLALVAGESTRVPRRLVQPSALDLAMLKASRHEPPAGILTDAGPARLAFIAGMDRAPLDLRLEAATRAVTFGALAPADLAKLYERVKPPRREAHASAPRRHASRHEKTSPRDPRSPRADALLYHRIEAALTASKPAAAALTPLLTQAAATLFDKAGLSPLIRTIGPALAALTPAPALAESAPLAARILLALGQTARAKVWAGLVDDAARSGDAGAQEAAARLWALFELADPTAPAAVDQADLQRWIDAGPKADGGRNAQAALLYVLLGALGHQVPASTWSHLYAPSLSIAATEPSPSILRGLRRATAAGRVGETLTFALLALGPGGSASADGTTLAAVIAGLERIDLVGEAHNLALEAALANGL